MLGLEGHEALIVAHDGARHPHVHVMPTPGRSAPSAGQPSNRDISNADNRDIFRAD